jgi:hypothetical protein
MGTNPRCRWRRMRAPAARGANYASAPNCSDAAASDPADGRPDRIVSGGKKLSYRMPRMSVGITRPGAELRREAGLGRGRPKPRAGDAAVVGRGDLGERGGSGAEEGWGPAGGGGVTSNRPVPCGMYSAAETSLAVLLDPIGSPTMGPTTKGARYARQRLQGDRARGEQH